MEPLAPDSYGLVLIDGLLSLVLMVAVAPTLPRKKHG
jgi:hypothetical protein